MATETNGSIRSRWKEREEKDLEIVNAMKYIPLCRFGENCQPARRIRIPRSSSSIVHCSCACAWLGIAMRGFQRRPPLRMLNETGGNVEEESREDPISVDFNEIHRDNSRRSFVRWAPCDFTRELTCENFIARYSVCMNVFTFSLIFNRSNLVYSMFTKILPLINSNSD